VYKPKHAYITAITIITIIFSLNVHTLATLNLPEPKTNGSLLGLCYSTDMFKTWRTVSNSKMVKKNGKTKLLLASYIRLFNGTLLFTTMPQHSTNALYHLYKKTNWHCPSYSCTEYKK
jgi:hypothetical protein